MPCCPEKRQQQGGWSWPEERLKPGKCVTSPARFLTEWSAEQGRVVVDSEGGQYTPVELPRVSEHYRRQYYIREDDNSTADDGCIDRPIQGRTDRKGAVAPCRKSVR